MKILMIFLLVILQTGQVNASESYDRLFNMAISMQPTSLDPQFEFIISNHEIGRHIYDPLFETDNNGGFYPVLVESYVAQSPTHWIITLKKNVKFHDGDELTTEDVIATFDRIRRAGKEGPYYSVFRASGYKAINRYQFELTTERPDPELLKSLNIFYIIKSEAARHDKTEFDSGKFAIGTGPYYLVSHDKEKLDSFVLKANENYHMKPAYIKNLKISVLPNKEDRVSAFLKKDIDFTGGLDYSDIKSALDMRSARITTPKADKRFYLLLNVWDDQLDYIRDNSGKPMNKNPLKDLRVRQAISLSIDRQTMVERIYGSSDIDATPTEQLMPEGSIGHISWAKVEKQNLIKSRELLKEAGYPDGFQLALIGRESNKKITSVITEMISQSGITAKVEILEDSQYREFFLKGGYAILERFGKVIDPIRVLNSHIEAAKYKNQEFDDLLRDASTTFNSQIRERKINQATEVILTDLPIISLFFRNNIWAIRPDMAFIPVSSQLTLAYEVVASR